MGKHVYQTKVYNTMNQCKLRIKYDKEIFRIKMRSLYAPSEY